MGSSSMRKHDNSLALARATLLFSSNALRSSVRSWYRKQLLAVSRSICSKRDVRLASHSRTSLPILKNSDAASESFCAVSSGFPCLSNSARALLALSS